MPSKLHYLEDSEITIKGLRIYGTPQQPIFLNWAFNRTSEQLERYFDEIPEGLDILLCHTAPYGIMDNVKNEWSNGNFGCKVLLERIKKVKPKYVVFGHFHGNYGIEKIEGTTFVNCSLIDERYIMTKKPIYIEIEK
jgi:Icc-related predicted phosphoesterase